LGVLAIFDWIWWFLVNRYFFSDGLGYFYIFEISIKYDVYQTFALKLALDKYDFVSTIFYLAVNL
jgi:hypothetical protein